MLPDLALTSVDIMAHRHSGAVWSPAVGVAGAANIWPMFLHRAFQSRRPTPAAEPLVRWFTTTLCDVARVYWVERFISTLCFRLNRAIQRAQNPPAP